MENTDQMNPQQLKIQGLLDRYLYARPTAAAADSAHLDDDTVAAFVEGTLTAREEMPTVSHLADCSFCRRRTAELVRLEIELAGDVPEPREAAESSPARVSDVLTGLLAKIFSPTDGAVFAHGEQDDDPEKWENEKQ